MKYSDFWDAFTPKDRKIASELHSRGPNNALYETAHTSNFLLGDSRSILRTFTFYRKNWRIPKQ